MDFGVIRNRKQADELADRIRKGRLPLRYALQEVYPGRSVEFNDYLWGFIYTPIANATGHTPEEVHEAYKRKYNFRHDFVFDSEDKKYKLVLAPGSTTRMDKREIWNYAMQIRAEAEIELHLTLLMPNEAFTDELDFSIDYKTI